MDDFDEAHELDDDLDDLRSCRTVKTIVAELLARFPDKSGEIAEEVTDPNLPYLVFPQLMDLLLWPYVADVAANRTVIENFLAAIEATLNQPDPEIRSFTENLINVEFGEDLLIEHSDQLDVLRPLMGRRTSAVVVDCMVGNVAFNHRPDNLFHERSSTDTDRVSRNFLKYFPQFSSAITEVKRVRAVINRFGPMMPASAHEVFVDVIIPEVLVPALEILPFDQSPLSVFFQFVESLLSEEKRGDPLLVCVEVFERLSAPTAVLAFNSMGMRTRKLLEDWAERRVPTVKDASWRIQRPWRAGGS